MRPIDTLFIVLVLSSFIKSSKQKYFILILPILAFLVSFYSPYIPISIDSFILPVIATLACIICLELAPIIILLLFSDYIHLWEAIMIPFLWFVINPLMENINTRINTESIPYYVRGLPIRIISLGILYYIIFPIIYL